MPRTRADASSREDAAENAGTRRSSAHNVCATSNGTPFISRLMHGLRYGCNERFFLRQDRDTGLSHALRVSSVALESECTRLFIGMFVIEKKRFHRNSIDAEIIIKYTYLDNKKQYIL